MKTIPHHRITPTQTIQRKQQKNNPKNRRKNQKNHKRKTQHHPTRTNKRTHTKHRQIRTFQTAKKDGVNI